MVVCAGRFVLWLQFAEVHLNLESVYGHWLQRLRGFSGRVASAVACSGTCPFALVCVTPDASASRRLPFAQCQETLPIGASRSQQRFPMAPG